MSNRVLILQPSHYLSKNDRRIYKTKRRSVVSLTLPYLAALVPNGWDVELLDEQIQDIDFDKKFDIVVISSWTINSLRVYDVAR